MRRGRIIASAEFMASPQLESLRSVLKIQNQFHKAEDNTYELIGTSPLFDIVGAKEEPPLYEGKFDSRGAVTFKRLN
jgi:hypothetical protein